MRSPTSARVRPAFAILLLFGCGEPTATSSPDENAAPSPAKSDRVSALMPEGQTLSCEPATPFCLSNIRWICTAKGDDGADPIVCGQQDLGGSVEQNPKVCATTQCENGDAACCRRQSPLCQFSLLTPNYGMTGADYVGHTTLCRLGDSAFHLLVASAQARQPAPGVLDAQFAVAIDDLTVFGHTLTLPDARIAVAFSQDAGGHDTGCKDFQGTVTFGTPPPTWSISVDVTCRTDPTIHVVGQLSGSK